MRTITPFLWYDTQAEEAMNFYLSIFKNGKALNVSRKDGKAFVVNFEILGQPSSQDQSLRINMVSEGYFPALKIALAQGRIWDATENRNGAGVAVVNQALVRKYFPKGNPIGRAIKVPFPGTPPLQFSVKSPTSSV